MTRFCKKLLIHHYAQPEEQEEEEQARCEDLDATPGSRSATKVCPLCRQAEVRVERDCICDGCRASILAAVDDCRPASGRSGQRTGGARAAGYSQQPEAAAGNSSPFKVLVLRDFENSASLTDQLKAAVRQACPEQAASGYSLNNNCNCLCDESNRDSNNFNSSEKSRDYRNISGSDRSCNRISNIRSSSCGNNYSNKRSSLKTTNSKSSNNNSNSSSYASSSCACSISNNNSKSINSKRSSHKSSNTSNYGSILCSCSSKNNSNISRPSSRALRGNRANSLPPAKRDISHESRTTVSQTGKKERHKASSDCESTRKDSPKALCGCKCCQNSCEHYGKLVELMSQALEVFAHGGTEGKSKKVKRKKGRKTKSKSGKSSISNSDETKIDDNAEQQGKNNARTAQATCSPSNCSYYSSRVRQSPSKRNSASTTYTGRCPAPAATGSVSLSKGLKPIAHYPPGRLQLPLTDLLIRNGDCARCSLVRTAAGITLHERRQSDQFAYGNASFKERSNSNSISNSISTTPGNSRCSTSCRAKQVWR